MLESTEKTKKKKIRKSPSKDFSSEEKKDRVLRKKDFRS